MSRSLVPKAVIVYSIMSAYSRPVPSSSVSASFLARQSGGQTEKEEKKHVDEDLQSRPQTAEALRFGKEHWNHAESSGKWYIGRSITGSSESLNCNHGKESDLQARPYDHVLANSYDRTKNYSSLSRKCKEHFCNAAEDKRTEPGHTEIIQGNWLGLSEKGSCLNKEQRPRTADNRPSRDSSCHQLRLREGNQFSPHPASQAAWIVPYTRTQFALRHNYPDLTVSSKSMDLETFRNKQTSSKSQKSDVYRDYPPIAGFTKAGENGTDQCQMYQAIFPVSSTNVSRGLQYSYGNVKTDHIRQVSAGSNYWVRPESPVSRAEKLLTGASAAIAFAPDQNRRGHCTAGRISRATSGRDRHSKVKTAKGLRDRRVRLSAATAVQFYDIQDRLGYDQPSKAVDWLMKKAKAAIDELPEAPCVASDCTATVNPIFGICTSPARKTSPLGEVASPAADDDEAGRVNSHTSLSQTMPFRTFIASKHDAIVESSQGCRHNDVAVPRNAQVPAQSQQGVSSCSTPESSRGFELTVSSAYARQESRTNARKRARERAENRNHGARETTGLASELQS